MIDIEFDQIIMNIRNGTYRRIGSGSGRRVFDLENGYVVKLAKNNRGLAQNKAEYQISLTDPSDIYAKVIAVSNNYSLLIMEKADRIKTLSDVEEYFHVTSSKELFHLEIISSFCTKNNVLQTDLYRPTNWGKINGRPVIVDYGFTQSVKRKYYTFL